MSIDSIRSQTFRERENPSTTGKVFLEIGVPFLAGTYDECLSEQLRLRAQTFEVLTGGEFAADHADGQDDHSQAQGKDVGTVALPLPPDTIDHLRVTLQVWYRAKPSAL